MVTFSLPADSPLRGSDLYRYLLISLLIQHSIWHLLANTVLKGAHNLKKRSWVLTAVAALVMTFGSLPYLRDLFLPPHILGSASTLLLRGFNAFGPLAGGAQVQWLRAHLTASAAEALPANADWEFFSLALIKPRTYTFTHPLCAFFIAYLLSDLALGAIYYPSMMNMASGWVHHTAYTFFFSYWLHRGWGHIAGTAAILELPTLVMGAGCLYPPLRSNWGFTLSFFATRIFLHFGLLIATFTESGRNAPGLNGSWGPFASVAITYPMHLFWGYKCILSVRKRMRKRALSKKTSLEQGLAAAKDAQGFDASMATEKAIANPSEILQKRRRPSLAQHMRIQLPALAVNAGRFFNGFAPPDVASALNTPAVTPTGGAIPVYANFGAAAPVVALSKAARAAADRLGRGRKRSASSLAGSASEPETDAESVGSSTALERRPSLQSNPKRHSTGGSTTPFGTSAVIPLDAGPDAFDKTPFLAIRSQAETTNRARRLVADAVRKAWAQRAPESWKREWEEEERRIRKEQEKRAKRRAEAVKAKKAAKEQAKREAAESRADAKVGRLSLDGTTDVGESSSHSSFSADDVDSIFEDAHAGEYFEPASYTDVESSIWSGLEDEDEDGVSNGHDPNLDESSVEDHSALSEEAAEAAKLSKMEKRKAAARRAIIRAVRRAINGREPTDDSDAEDMDDALEDAALGLPAGDEQDADASEEEGPIDENDFFAQAARQQRRAERAAARAAAGNPQGSLGRSSRSGKSGKRKRLFFDRSLAPLDWNAFVKLLPAEFSRDQDSFVVRELQVERGLGAGERRKRIVGELRRRMEVARRDVIVCDY
ncbi:hypothetical protein OC835_004425 [Tilletia horrida]|nr:hypothetical protein OC835_004425 [Tilletia horrida]